MNYDEIINDVIEEYKNKPVDILENGDAEGEYNYLRSQKSAYVRTVNDIDSMFNVDRNSINILEIGSFLGAVSISLKKVGFNVSATDIPEFSNSSSLRSVYERNEIPFVGTNLKNTPLPYDSNSFDMVVICEVLEHFNFNPLPALQEINRVLKDGGYIYIGMPNIASLKNRIKLLLGYSIHNPLDDYFKQLDRRYNMIVGLHWREYTLKETSELIEKMGFETVKRYYFQDEQNDELNLIKKNMKRFFYSYPPFRSFQVVIGRKEKSTKYDFWLTDANT